LSRDALPDDPFPALVASLKALASEPSDQLALFPESVSKASDLVARFEASVRAARDESARELSRSQLEALEALGERLAIVSRDGAEFDADVWTDEAVRTSVHWREVRALAKAALDRFETASADVMTHEAG
jgi:regulator of protease activity HflC (stomatin/prohibitin superfamily)